MEHSPNFPPPSTLPLAKLTAVQDKVPLFIAPPTGRAPYRIVRGDEGLSAVLNADGRTLFLTYHAVADSIVSMANVHVDLLADAANMAEALLDVKGILQGIKYQWTAHNSDSIKAALQRIEQGLFREKAPF